MAIIATGIDLAKTTFAVHRVRQGEAEPLRQLNPVVGAERLSDALAKLRQL